MPANRIVQEGMQSENTMTNKMRQFFKGTGSVIDLGGTSVHSHMRIGHGLDFWGSVPQALSNDWQKLAQDFGSAFNTTVGSGKHGKPE